MHPSVPAGNYMFKVVKYVWNMFKVNNRDSRTTPILDRKWMKDTHTIKDWRCSGVFIVNFEHILHLVLVLYPFKIFFKTPGSFFMRNLST